MFDLGKDCCALTCEQHFPELVEVALFDETGRDQDGVPLAIKEYDRTALVALATPKPRFYPPISIKRFRTAFMVDGQGDRWFGEILDFIQATVDG